MVLTPLQSTAASLTTAIAGLFTWPQVLSLIPLGIAVWWVWKRTQEGDDPSGSVAIESATGSFSVLISGAYWIAALVGLAAFLMWDVLTAEPMLAAVPVGLVAYAWWLERQEVAG